MNRRLFSLFAVVGVCSFLFLASNVSAMEGISYQHWVKYRDALKEDPSLVIYYTFEKGEGSSVENQADIKGASRFDGEVKEGNPDWTEGRWPEKKALSFDSNYLIAEPYDIKNKAFTCEMWIRKNGALGNHKSGTIIGVSGYYSGWRITTYCTTSDGPIMFSIGRPKGAFGIRTTSVTDNVWHHLVATWDGKIIRLYIDGTLNIEKEYSGDYTPADPEKKYEHLKIGYANLGVGSVKLDVDEVTIYNRVLSEEEIRNHRYLKTLGTTF